MPFHETLHSPPGGGAATVFRSEIFSLSIQMGQAVPDAACSSCPASLWYRDDGLRCFCTIIKIETWSDNRQPVLACAGRESAIAAWEKQEEQKHVGMRPK